MKRSHLVKLTMIVFFSLGSVGVVGGSFFLRRAFSSSSQSQVITDVSRYQEIRQQLWQNQDAIKHFPAEIPKDTKNLRIAYSPGVSQASIFFQARLKQSPAEIQKLQQHYRKLAKHQYRGGNSNDHTIFPNGVPTTFFYTSDSGGDSFPSTYEILVLNAQDKGTPGFKWNHGNSYGVAIDNTSSEIIYWSEEW
ncbi:hypothetical protein [Nostoc sp. CMAA1605]|uniref:hypothetical protein n=1 Tax=Nostoc sp. CMAA1605 TaxID=2055159 RepID=UPI001F16375E|nr:hypothetical protein [Nostoc sp. CMAA1605]